LSIEVASWSPPNATIGVTFSESSEWVSPTVNNGLSDERFSEALYLSVGQRPRTYSLSEDHIRGGFHYLTLSGTAGAVIEPTSTITNFTSVPHRDPRKYTGYFHSNDELLNRIWYAGKYACGLFIGDGAYKHSRCLYHPALYHRTFHSRSGLRRRTAARAYTRSLNTTVCYGQACIVDGSKRDRLVYIHPLVLLHWTSLLPSLDICFNSIYTDYCLTSFPKPDTIGGPKC
jgi:hypothetical protein